MPVTTANINYINTNFPFPVLTKITNLPMYESLKKIKDKLKNNAASVPCDLGGGANGHLDLMLSDVEYAMVNPNTHYI